MIRQRICVVIATALCAVAAHTIPHAEVQAHSTPRFSRATISMAKTTLNDLATQATSVVRGRIQSSQVKRTENGIITEVILHVQKTFKGHARKEVVVSIAGGSLPEETLWIPQAPKFNNQEEVVLFLWSPEGDSTTGILGLNQGVIRILPGELPVGIPLLGLTEAGTPTVSGVESAITQAITLASESKAVSNDQKAKQ